MRRVKMTPNKYITALKPYRPIPHSIWNMKNLNQVLKLDWNESTIPPSPKVFAALQNALTKSNLHWYPNTHNIELLEQISLYTQLPQECIEVFASSDCAHEFILQVFAMPQDTICIIAPTYDNFRARAEGIGLKTLFFQTQDDYMLDFDALDSFLCINKPKIVYLCNPNNPTGTLHNINALTHIITKHKHILFVIDEAYYEFCKQSVIALLPHTHNLIITRTFSKAFGLASFRIGYCLSSKTNIDSLNKLKNPKSITHFSQIAAHVALQDIDYMTKYVDEVTLAREQFTKNLRLLSDFKIYPSQANFVLVKYPYIHKILDFLQLRQIFIRDYSHILPNHCRISIGTREQMDYVAQTLKEYQCNK